MAGPDLSSYSTADLQAAISAPAASTQQAMPDLSQIPTEDLIKIVGKAKNTSMEPTMMQTMGSALVRGAGDVGDAVQYVADTLSGKILANNAATAITGQPGFPPEPGLGDAIRSASDYAFGPGSTEKGKGSLLYEGTRMIPGFAAGEGEFSIPAALRTLWRASAATGLGAVGEEYGGPTGKVIGQIAGGSSPEALKAVSSATSSLLLPKLSEEQSLLQAYRVPPKQAGEVGPQLMNLKDEGVLTGEGAAPFKASAQNLRDALRTSATKLDTKMASAAPIQISDVMPSMADFEGIVSGAEHGAVSSAVQKERENLFRIGVERQAKIDPSIVPEAELSDYRALTNQAANGDKAAQALVHEMENSVGQVTLSGPEVRNIRMSMDDIPNWDTTDGTARAGAYKAMRGKLQKGIIEATGGPGSEAAQAFQEYSNLVGAKKFVAGEGNNLGQMEGLEYEGKLRQPTLLGKIATMIGSPGQSLKNLFTSGSVVPHNEAMLLKQGVGTAHSFGAYTAPVVSSLGALESQPNLGSQIQPQGISQEGRDRTSQSVSPYDNYRPSSLTTQGSSELLDNKALFHALEMIESSGNPNARNPHSTAKGRLQWTDPAAKRFGVTPGDYKSELAGLEREMAANRAQITKNHPGLTAIALANALIGSHKAGGGGVLDKNNNITDQDYIDSVKKYLS